MNFYALEPEVAGGLGPDSIIEGAGHPPNVTRLHYELEGWLGDDLLESFPCYIVTEKMRSIMEECNVSGYQFDVVQVSVSDEYRELNDNEKLPRFWWLKVSGTAGQDDVGISETHSLVVSERLLEVMQNARLDNCDIEDFAA